VYHWGLMDGPGVTIVDRVTLGAGDAMAWLGRLRSDYAPGAERRGMQLAAAWWSHVGPDAVEVTVRWDLADVAAFWAMRRAAGQDPAVLEWWTATDALATARSRNVCARA
jgi:NIPSNAP protein